MRKRIVRMITALLLVLLCLTGCGGAEAAKEFTSPDQLNDSRYTVGVGMGTADVHSIEENLPNAKMIEYSSVEDGYLAVQAGMLDGFAFSRDAMEYALGSGSLTGVKLLEESVGEGVDVVVGISPKTTVPDLTQKINDFIAAIHADGTFDEMYMRWVNEDREDLPEIPKPEHPAFKITVGTSGTAVPFSYYRGTELTGMDLEMIARFGAYVNAEIEIVVLDYVGLSAASEAGTLDCVFANLHATPERAESMDFSDPLYTLQTGLMVRSGDGTGSAVRPHYTSVDQLKKSGIRLGLEVGTSLEPLTFSEFPDATPVYYPSIADMVHCVASGELDGFLCDEPAARMIVAETDGVTYLSDSIMNNSYAVAFPKTAEGSALCEEFSECVRQWKSDGTMQEIIDAWIHDDRAAQRTDYGSLPNINGVIRMAGSSVEQPFGFVRDGKYVGMDLDLVIRFCEAKGYALELSDIEFSALIASLGATSDLASAGLSITEERKEQVFFSEPFYDGGIVMVVKADSAAQPNFFERIASSFEKTFVREQRWKLILRGIGTTVFISVFSALFGTLLGFGICMLRRMKNRFTHALTTAYIRILQGTPQVVLLMVLFYLVFSGTGLSGEWVAIIAFSLNFAAYVSEMMRTGINAVDIGQTEAALALGFTRSRTFFRFILPQAAQNFLPVYKGEFISLVKMTSVVGYIAVQDLTKMSDIIRSRTYEAFFPLITTALIYFLISGLLTFLLRYAELKIEPDRKTSRENRVVKGVKMK